MGNSFADNELSAAGFPESTREVCYIEPVDELAGGARELELEVTVQGVVGDARMAVGYVPGGPITAGQQIIRGGERRILKKQLVKPGSMLVVALDQPARVDVRVTGAQGWDTEEADQTDLGDGWDVDEADDVPLEADGVCSDVDPDQVVLGADDSAAALGALAGAVAGITPPPLVGAAPSKNSPPANAAEIMDRVIADLEQLASEAKRNRAGTFIPSTAAGTSVDYWLSQANNLIASLRTSRELVLAGDRPLKSGDANAPGWLEAADGVGQTINSNFSLTNKWSLTSTLAKVAPELGKIGEGINDTLKTVAVILGLVLLVKWL